MHINVEYRPSGSLAWLLLKNAALNLITLTIYRFWAKTRVRQYFWQAVRVDGEPFEYTGLGRELLIGFLIVLAVLAPATLAWSTAQTLLSTDPVGLSIAQGIYFFILFVLIQAAGFRARRYRLSRTLWRGIRAGQDGSTWRYVGQSLLWGLASAATLGLAYPSTRLALQRYRTVNTRFGDQHFSFDAPLMPLFTRWLVVLTPLILFYLVIIGFSIAVERSIGDSDAEAVGRKIGEAMVAHGKLMGVALVLLAILPFTWAWYRMAEFRHFAAHTRLGEITFRSTARGRAILIRLTGFALAALGATILVGLLVFWWSRALISLGMGQIFAFATVGGVLGLLLVLFGYRFLWTMIVTAGLVRHICETLEISGLETLDGVAQASAPSDKYGEGLADSFEVAG